MPWGPQEDRQRLPQQDRPFRKDIILHPRFSKLEETLTSNTTASAINQDTAGIQHGTTRRIATDNNVSSRHGGSLRQTAQRQGNNVRVNFPSLAQSQIRHNEHRVQARKQGQSFLHATGMTGRVLSSPSEDAVVTRTRVQIQPSSRLRRRMQTSAGRTNHLNTNDIAEMLTETTAGRVGRAAKPEKTNVELTQKT
jgi:hypothetical protein